MQITKRKGALAAIAVLAIVVTAHCVRADEFTPDRFKGGSADGYASVSFYRDAFSASLVRFHGGSGDGYDEFTESGLQVPVWGTVILVR
ncbi:MAG: hypothetical protein PF904_03050 [Kiritimatiellae bacterium]|jgi:hypothetical protein|nr:hypothetical protein [Kiritimatiellia bacterium]